LRPSFIPDSCYFEAVVRVGVDDERRDTVVAGARVGDGLHEDAVGDVRVRDELFRSVEDVLARVGVVLRGRVHIGGVGAASRLRERPRAQLAALGQRAEPRLLLLGRAEQLDRFRTERSVCGVREPDPAGDAAELLGDHGVHELVAAQPAVLLAHRDAHHVEVVQLGEHLVGEPVFVLDLLGDRPDLRLTELADGVEYHPVFCG